jgi:hypothetical protein
MSTSLPWSSRSTAPASSDPNDALRQIEQNTASLVQWVKILVVVVVLLVIINLLFLV